jgi:hypothetical protein
VASLLWTSGKDSISQWGAGGKQIAHLIKHGTEEKETEMTLSPLKLYSLSITE